jgi:hypothetical protein
MGSFDSNDVFSNSEAHAQRSMSYSNHNLLLVIRTGASITLVLPNG